MAILAVTALVSYERAKAESLGLSAKGGLMERGERMFLLGVSFLSTVIFVPVLWVLLVLVSFTAISRFVKVWNAASGTRRRHPAPHRSLARGAGRLALAGLARRPASPPACRAGIWPGRPVRPWAAGGPVGRSR